MVCPSVAFLGSATITTAGVAQAGIVVASTYAIVRAGDDIEATLNDRQRSLVSQGLDNINSYLSNDPRNLTDNQILSADLAMMIVEIGPGFAYAIRGKQVLQQTSNASRGGGFAASIADNIDESGEYVGEVEDLIAAIRNIENNGPGGTWLRKIADHIEETGLCFLESDLAFDTRLISRGIDPDEIKTIQGITMDGGVIYLRRSRGENILRNFVHEGTHAIDLRTGVGIFRKEGSKWYAKDIDSMTGEQIFLREFRAYRNENFLGGTPRFQTKQELTEYILRNYTGAEVPT